MRSSSTSFRRLALSGSMLAILLSVGSSTTWAQGVGPPLGGSVSSYQFFNGWFIDDQTGADIPMPVIRDPNGAPWMKELTGANAGDNMIAQPGDVFSVHERLLIDGNLSWKDWHEEILTPDWEWVGTAGRPLDLWVNGASAPGLSIMNMPASGGMGGGIWFDFDEAFPGDVIDVFKNIQYVGAPGTFFDGTILIAEYPTPEPATMALLGTGGLALIRRRRRRHAMA